MAAKSILLFCAQVLLIQSISGQCIGYNGLGYDGFGYGAPLAGPGPCGPWGYNEYPGIGPAPFAPANGGGFAVSSTSPITPNGISVFSENAIEGTLNVGGVLPFLGTVALEAVLPTAGAGTVAYGCGNGAVGITAEDGFGYPGAYAYGAFEGPLGYGPGPIGYGPAYDGPFGYGPGPIGYGPGYGPGYGCGAYY